MMLDVSEVRAELDLIAAEAQRVIDAENAAANRRPEAVSALSKLLGAFGG